MTKHDDDRGERIVRFIIAKGSAEQVQSYVDRGRRFKELSDDELSNKYAEGMHQMASDPANSDLRLLLDAAQAEYELRGTTPPEDVATEALERIVDAAMRVYDEMSDARKAEISAEMAAEYDQAKKERH